MLAALSCQPSLQFAFMWIPTLFSSLLFHICVFWCCSSLKIEATAERKRLLTTLGLCGHFALLAKVRNYTHFLELGLRWRFWLLLVCGGPLAALGLWNNCMNLSFKHFGEPPPVPAWLCTLLLVYENTMQYTMHYINLSFVNFGEPPPMLSCADCSWFVRPLCNTQCIT